MIHWLISMLLGLTVGILLYGCVRIRIIFGPLAAARFGRLGRLEVWLGCLLLMVFIAEGGLMLIRVFLAEHGTLLHEIVFAAVALIVGVTLVAHRALKDNNTGVRCPLGSRRNAEQ